jgi:Xaa-Pro aminopeptidase
MFSRQTYISRRNELKQRLGTGLILLLGNEESSMNYGDNWYPFRQDSSFLYFSGIDKAHLALVIDIDENREILFGEEATMDDIIWQGHLASLKEIADGAGITGTGSWKDLGSYLLKKQSKGRAIHFLPPYRPEHSEKLYQVLNIQLGMGKQRSSIPLIKAIVHLRSIKTEEEIAEIEKAVNLTNAMQLAAIEYTRSGMPEAEIAGRLHGLAISKGGNIAFPTILTTHGETLHIHYSHNKVSAGDMVLCDCGAETAMHYSGDLTRTFPVNAGFSSVQKEAYAVVLSAQEAAAAALKPGVLFKDIHLLACEKLVEGLKLMGLMKGDAREAVNAHAHTLFFQCGLGHMLGLDTHDMENLGEEYVGYTDTLKKSTVFGLKSLRLGRTLEPGFVVTVEPGLYFIPALMDQWKAEKKNIDFINYDAVERFRNFGGIRIEEDFLITQNASRTLGDPLVKDTASIEAIRKANS